ncbi:unnamed protein product [Parnassius mnemosyne]|uniref:Uncharacterized protein n=1 Tax=Parnassius mnemosyne TaxID=213953 RepID=A0AAV1LWQ1_9NEOP
MYCQNASAKTVEDVLKMHWDQSERPVKADEDTLKALIDLDKLNDPHKQKEPELINRIRLVFHTRNLILVY